MQIVYISNCEIDVVTTVARNRLQQVKYRNVTCFVPGHIQVNFLSILILFVKHCFWK